MKHTRILLVVALIPISLIAQKSDTGIQQERALTRAISYYQEGNYSLAYPLLRELGTELNKAKAATSIISAEDLAFYTISCGLMQGEESAEKEAEEFASSAISQNRKDRIFYSLGEYSFRKQQFQKAAEFFDRAGMVNLTNAEVSHAQFCQGYSFFALGNFDNAKPFLSSVKSLEKESDYAAANYYFGLLAFREKNYSEAYASFLIAEKEPAYFAWVPYYIAQIYLLQGNQQKAIDYIEKKLSDVNLSQQYSPELHQLLGHSYFTKKEYSKALTNLSIFVERSEKVLREDVYELAFCHYATGNLDKAIDGFKQLSGKEDSLSQHAMYLLGDAYLKKGNKPGARNAFLFCSINSSDAQQKEISTFQYAKLSFELGYQDEALNSFKSFLADYPNSTYSKEATELMADLLAGTNNFREALSLIETIQAPSARVKQIYPRVLLGRALEYYNEGDSKNAAVLIDKALLDANNYQVLPYLNYWKGELQFEAGAYYSAIDYYNSFVKSGVSSVGEVSELTANYSIGYSYLKLAQYDKALAYFEKVSLQIPKDKKQWIQDVMLRSADCNYMLRNFTKAAAVYEKSIQENWPTADYSTYQLAMIAGIKNSTKKISLLETVIKKYPGTSLLVDSKMEIADTYMGDEKFKQAIPYLLDMIASVDNSTVLASAYLKSGISYYNTDQNEKAVVQLKSLIDKYPNAPEVDDAVDNLKAIYLDEGKSSDYISYMKQIGRPVEVQTEDSLTYASADVNATKLIEDKKNAAAIAVYNSYLSKFPEGNYKLDATYNLAQLLAAEKDTAGALKNYQVLVENAPNAYAESASLYAARITFFDLKDYSKAAFYYQHLFDLGSTAENKLEALRGLLRSQYQQKMWEAANETGKLLGIQKSISTDDKSLIAMSAARANQLIGKNAEAFAEFKNVIALNKAGLAAEARYEVALYNFQQSNFTEAEKAAFETINKSSSYAFWTTKSYLLLGDIYFAQKDYFNAKATYQSVYENTDIEELKLIAKNKLDQVEEAEKKK